MTQPNDHWWPEPAAGDIVWCRFPHDLAPAAKPRPALLLVVFDDNAPQFRVLVAYGTSQRTTTLFSGEFAILKEQNAAAYRSAGLSYNTKFDLNKRVDLPYSAMFFGPPPARPHGNNPKLGTLHASAINSFRAAANASTPKKGAR